jgi:hypothetical protein
MEYYSLKNKGLKPEVGKLYRNIVEAEDSPPFVVTEIDEGVQYCQLSDPDFEQMDSIKVFCVWYGEW